MVTIKGTSSDDNLVGTSGDEKIYGFAGDDFLYGDDGNDSLFGGSGDDSLWGWSGDDYINPGSAGTYGDWIDTGFGFDTIDLSNPNQVGVVIVDHGSIDTASDVRVVVKIDGNSNFGEIRKFSGTASGGVTNILGLKNVLAAPNLDGFIVHGTDGNDVFRVNPGIGGWIGINPGEGTDRIYIGAEGTTRLSYYYNLHGITADLRSGKITKTTDSGEAIDVISGKGHATQFSGSFYGDDTIYGSNRDEIFTGTVGDDYIDGRGGNDWIKFTSEHSEVTVNLQSETAKVKFTNIFSGIITFGDQTIKNIENVRGTYGNDTIVGSKKDNVLLGRTGNDVIKGGGGHDTLRGEEGDDTLNGGAGNDTLEGGAGNDVFIGGKGWDIVVFDGTSKVVVDLSQTGPQDTKSGLDTFTGIEAIRAGSGNDMLKGSRDNNRLEGNDGNDALFGLGGNDTLVGGIGDDILNGGDGEDTAIFSGTVDVRIDLTVSGQQDTGYGNDTLVSIENITAGDGNDVLTGNGSANRLSGGAGKDRLSGAAGNDVLTGGNGDDVLLGGSGNDVLKGGDGEDTVIYRGAADATVDISNSSFQKTGYGRDRLVSVEHIISGKGDDQLVGNAAENVIKGGKGSDQIKGMAGSDQLFGEEGADRLYGGDGNDELFGGDGDDWLYADSGADILTGGAGKDRFVFDMTSGECRIVDFENGTDKIDVRAFGTLNKDDDLLISPSGSDTHISIDGTLIILEGIARSAIDRYDFIGTIVEF